ncbi:MAG: MarR family transcriptional regulator [Actinomycetota bacterium]|nr:MarR family transcriptional regulator [Actinomycetota bacterium]
MDSLGRDLVLLAKAMRARLESRLANAGASLPAWGVLSCAIEEEGLSQRQLAERMGIEAATLTRHLDRLEADGLVVRHRDGDDRRILRVVPTPAARDLHARMAAVAGSLDADLTAGLCEEELAELRRLLARLSSNLGDTPLPPGNLEEDHVHGIAAR